MNIEKDNKANLKQVPANINMI